MKTLGIFLTNSDENNILWYILQYGCHILHYIMVQLSYGMLYRDSSVSQQNFNGLNTDGSFTTAVLNSFLSPLELENVFMKHYAPNHMPDPKG